MTMPFRFEPLSARTFAPLFTLTDEELAVHNARWMVADATPGYPCRVSLEDAETNERVLLVHFTHHDVDSPYRAAGPIFVRESAETAQLDANEIPKMLRHRALSIRAYDAQAMMVTAQTTSGQALEEAIEELLGSPKVGYLHIHNAGPGCYNCSVRRA